jgi:WD40 repeat protein
MSPEQVRGLPVDARSDVFSFGVVLYELVSGKHPFRRETTVATLSAVLEGEPAELSSVVRGVSPAVVGIVRRCLEKERESRYPSGHELAVALEAVAGAAPGSAVLQEAEEKSPYPGLLSFTERDAASFFGRETEVLSLWERVRSRRLSGVIGPSGAGKTSFVRAGVVASRPPGWGTLVCTPGATPLRGLGQALGPELAGDPEALRQLAGFDDPAVAFDLVSRWRKAHGEALLIVDQFEELFTLNPAEVQERFAGLLGRLAREADVHVLLSLRDDFLMKCADHEPIAKVFESLSPLPALSREGLRRAVEEPAKARGYRFEDEALVGEMVESVEGARAALPLLAFAVSRLWEKRDREKRLLTRAAYEEIGGVAGALAQHAEATLDRIGSERQGMVREIFRTLVTSHGTRAVAEREEVLSLFPLRKAAEEVLGQLVDARLLTSYELEGAEGQPSHHRVEIVHESLVKAWPRLVRWQAQDEEGALLRDQLKQAAHLWEEKRRPADLLWSGTSFREYELWRERYAGALTALEKEFAKAMVERARRRRRLTRAAVAAAFTALAGVAIAIGISRQQAATARDQAKTEALRAEAGKLLALAQTHLADDPTAALAHVRGSLGLFDTPEARRLAVEVLWRGPVARILDVGQAAKQLQLPEEPSGPGWLVVSPDGRWLASTSGRRILLFPGDGGPARTVPLPSDTAAGGVLAFGPRSDLLIAGGSGHTLKFWSLPDLRAVRTVPLGKGVASWWGLVRGEKLVIVTQVTQKGDTVTQVLTLPDGEPRMVADHRGEAPWPSVDPTGTRALVTRGRAVVVRFLDATNRVRVLGHLRDDPWDIAYSPRGDIVAATDQSTETTIWPMAEGAVQPVRILQGPKFSGNSFTLFDPDGRRVSQAGPNGTNSLWDLEGFPDAQPLVFGRPGPSSLHAMTYDPSGQWLAVGDLARTTVEFWPVSGPWRRVLPGFAAAWSLAFTPDGRWLATCPSVKPAGLWPLNAADGHTRSLAEGCVSLAMDPTGRHVLVGAFGGKVLLSPLQGGTPRRLLEGQGGPRGVIVAFGPEGRRALAAPIEQGGIGDPQLRVLRLWNLPSGRERIHSIAHLTDAEWGGWWPAFAPDGRVYAAGQGGVHLLSLPSEPGGAVSSETVYSAGAAGCDLSRDGRLLLVWATRSRELGTPRDELLLFDLTAKTSRRITTHGARLWGGSLSPSGRIIVTGDHDGVVRVGPVTGEEPHLLIGQKGPVLSLAISPDERWLASSTDESISIWPMPDVTKPPLHTLPHAELLAKLDALTNLRVVRDPASATGWKLEVGPFSGWQDVPTW